MTQLKHRIAIGKIVNGEWKHERYATPEEMEFLRVSASGKVERLSFNRFISVGEFVGDHCAKTLQFNGWQDVSDTHRVEWGMETNDKDGNPLDIYNGDIFVDWNTGIHDKCSKPVIFNLFEHYDFLCADQFPMVEILGNIHENQELLEEVK